jgi:hypothetical protein
VAGCLEQGGPSGVLKIVFCCVAEGMLASADGVFSMKVIILVAGLILNSALFPSF